MPLFHGFANLSGTDIIKGSINHLHGRRKGCLIDVATWTPVDENPVLFNDVISMIPMRESFPIVGTYHKDKLMFGIGCGKCT